MGVRERTRPPEPPLPDPAEVRRPVASRPRMDSPCERWHPRAMLRSKRAPTRPWPRLLPMFLATIALACTSQPEEPRSAREVQPSSDRIAGQPAAKTGSEPASAVAPSTVPARPPAAEPQVAPADRGAAPTAKAVPSAAGNDSIRRPARVPRTAPTCAPGFRQVGEEDKDCSTFGECCKPESGAP